MILETGVSFVRVHLFVFYILVKGLNSRALASKKTKYGRGVKKLTLMKWTLGEGVVGGATMATTDGGTGGNRTCAEKNKWWL